MKLKATPLGKRLAQYPYDRVVILNAEIRVSGDRHEYLIPFNQLLAIHCKRSLVWGKLESVLPDEKVAHLRGTEWAETQRFHHYLNTLWQQWSQEMSDVATGVLQQQLDAVAARISEGKWLAHEQTSELQQQIRHAFAVLSLLVNRLGEFGNCRETLRQYQAWSKDTEACCLQHNQAYTNAMLEEYAESFQRIEPSPLNPAQARVMVGSEQSLLILAGAGSGKTSVLVAQAGWLLARKEAAPKQILSLAFGRRAVQEMDDRIRERLCTNEVAARTFHSLALHTIS